MKRRSIQYMKIAVYCCCSGGGDVDLIDVLIFGGLIIMCAGLSLLFSYQFGITVLGASMLTLGLLGAWRE